MRILHISVTNLAYAPVRFVNLINKYTEHEARLIQQKDFFRTDLRSLVDNIYQSQSEIIDCLNWADILHLHGSHVIKSRRIKGVKLPNKPIVLHYHGSPQREGYKVHQYQGNLLVSTPEMLPLFPNATYFPNLIDEKDRSLYPLCQSSTFKICHHFSLHPNKKDTHIFNQLSDSTKYLIPRCSLIQSAKQRAKFPIVFDHLQGYYGLVSIEALAQGICAITALSPHTQSHLIKFFGSLPPFFITSKETFFNDLELLKNSYRNLQQKSLEFMKSHWSGESNILKLTDYYKRIN